VSVEIRKDLKINKIKQTDKLIILILISLKEEKFSIIQMIKKKSLSRIIGMDLIMIHHITLIKMSLKIECNYFNKFYKPDIFHFFINKYQNIKNEC